MGGNPPIGDRGPPEHEMPPAVGLPEDRLMRSRRTRRSALALVALGILLAAMAGPASAGSRAENLLPGTPGWDLAPAPVPTLAQTWAGQVVSIDGYAGRASVAPGETLDLHVGVAAAGMRYRVQVDRLGWYGGVGARQVACLPSCGGDRPGVVQPAPPAPSSTGLVAAGWSATDALPIGADWPSGYYIAQLVITAGAGQGTARWVPFIVRPAPGQVPDVMVVAPVNTWQAYNNWGGKSLYGFNSTQSISGSKVSFDRPLSQVTTYGPVNDPVRLAPYSLFSFDYQLVRFLEREGHEVGYVTDVDVAGHGDLLIGPRLDIVAGHSEYWTGAQRDALDAARAAGVNLFFPGANDGYWQVRLEDGGRTLVGYKENASSDPVSGPGRTTLFRSLGRPECQLLGVQYYEDTLNSSHRSDHVARDLTVTAAGAANPWLAGSGLTQGATVGGVVGYEWDQVTPGCATPGPLTVLLHRDVVPAPSPYPADPSADAVTYADPASGARVLSAGTLQFSWMLDSWRDGVSDYRDTGAGTSDPRVQAFVRRALLDLAPPPVPPPAPAGPGPGPGAVGTGAPLLVPRHGPVLEWGFGERSGRRVHDTRRAGAGGVIRGARRIAAGRFGPGIAFSDRRGVLVSGPLAGLAGAPAVTLEAWIRPGRPGRFRVLRLTGGPRPLVLAVTAGPRRIRGSRTAPRVAVGRWTHVAISANATVVRIYVNDVVAARRATRGAVAWGDVLKVGGGFIGRVDEVRVLVGARGAAGLHADARHPVPSRRTTSRD